MKSKVKTKSATKKRANKYEANLKIHASFGDALKALVREPKKK